MNCSSGFSVSYVLLSKTLFWCLQFGFSGFICFGLPASSIHFFDSMGLATSDLVDGHPEKAGTKLARLYANGDLEQEVRNAEAAYARTQQTNEVLLSLRAPEMQCCYT